MDASLTEYLDKELGRPVRNSVRLREVRCTVDHDKEPDDSSNAAKIAGGGFEHGQQFNCHVARGELAFIHANLIAHLPAEELAALFAKAAGEMNLATAGMTSGRTMSRDFKRWSTGDISRLRMTTRVDPCLASNREDGEIEVVN
jgi:hypothetical protein